MMNTPPNPYSNRPPTIVVKTVGDRSTMKIVFGLAASLIATLLGLIVLLLIGVETGPIALLIGLISATLPVPLYLIMVLWIDRYESEPLWMLTTAFFWGALVAVFIAFLFNTASSVLVATLTDSLEAGEAFGAVISAPIVEESAKAFILLLFFFWRKDEFDGVVDGIVYAAMAGLGFAMTENIQYYGRALLQGGTGGLTGVFILRGALAPFSHPLFTSLTGLGLGLARQSRNVLAKFLTPVIGLLGAIFLHSIWNGSAVLFGGPGFLLTYVLFMVPAFFLMLLVIFLALRKEGHTIREFLLSDLQGGLLTADEYTRLCTIRGRMGASFNALSHGGMSQWRTCRRFNQVASELAFHRSRVARGISSHDAAEREAHYRETLDDLARRLRVN